ncbi:MAG: class D sortase [Terriglobia bacterium]
MRAFSIAVCTWILVASGSFLAVRGFLEYRESHTAQDEISQEWNQENAPDAVSPAPGTSTREAVEDLPVRNTPASGIAVAKLSFPSLHSVLYVVEGTGDRDLKRGPGHLTGTVLPGENGNCVIAGHRDTHFRVLQNIRRGDEVILERSGQRFRYRVDSMTIVDPTNTASLQPSTTAELNLITCYPFHYVGSAPKRYIVHADLENSSLQASE